MTDLYYCQKEVSPMTLYKACCHEPRLPCDTAIHLYRPKFLFPSFASLSLQASERYKVDTPMCHAVLSTIRTLENTNVASLDSTNIKKTTPLISIDSYSDPNAVKGRMSAINRAYTSRTDDAWHRHPSVWESSYRCVQIGVTLLAILVLMAILAEVLEP